MDPKQIGSLAKLLRDSGDKVLNANFKLTLSGSLLRSLNDSFPLIVDQNESYAPHQFQVVKPNNSKADVFRDLQFIHDFVQKTRILSITQFHFDDSYDNHVDISKFYSLKRLEIHRVFIKQIIGIQKMRAYLQEIICQKSINNIKDIISHCGGDNCTGFVWNQLKLADFSYNNLITIDCSLEFAPWLQHLNLSHNKITNVDAIKWLPNLKYLNLSFNRLTHIPMFHMDASKRLKTLIVSNNYIEDVIELSRLDALNELDLSANCILDHSLLMPISTLIALQYLNLEDNPLACSIMHRQATARYLHKSTSSVKFLLDSEPLSKSEKSLTGTYQSYHMILTSRVSMGTFPRSSGQSTPLRQTQDNTPASSFSSRNSYRTNDTSTAIMHHSSFDEMNASSSSSVITASAQKKIKARIVIIDDDKPHPSSDQPSQDEKINEKQIVKKPSFEGNKAHLETKKQIEHLCKTYGNDWLLNHGENIVPSDCENIRETRESIVKSLETISINSPTPTPTLEKNEIVFNPLNADDSTPTNIENTEEFVEKDGKRNSLNEIYAPTQIVEEISDAEDNEVTYIVYQKPNDIEIFLVVSDLSIKEKDILTAKTKAKWDIKTLESCDQIKSDILRLNFDTIKKDRKERIYKVEKGLCQKLEQYLRNILSKRPLSEMNQTLYKCANCTTQFSRENIYKKQNIDVCCPECKSAYVLEIKESPRGQSIERIGQATNQQLPQPNVLVDKAKALAMQTCESQSSIGSATSLNESSSCSKISKSNSFDSNQSVAGSSNCDRDADFQSKTGKNTDGDSDIEILSNPSQSSIEVLDSYSSNRKLSDGQQHRSGVSQIPTLDPITDTSFNNLQTLVNQQTSTQDLDNTAQSGIDSGYDTTVYCENDKLKNDEIEKKAMILSGVQLTESSSSGSVTDSICTTYEQNRSLSGVASGSLTPESLTKVTKKSPEKIVTRADSSVISSMLGGLFQSTNNLMSRTPKSATSPEQPCDPFTFSYTDFDTVDHRLKLFLYQNIFEDDNEHLKWLVKGKMCYDHNAGGDERTVSGLGSSIFIGIFVMSTTKFYVLQIFDKENDDVSKWVKRTLSGTIDRLEMIRVLPWKIGISFKIKNADNAILFLQDISRTDNLLLFFANNPLSSFCTLEYQISERLSQKLLKTTSNTQLQMLAILNSIDILCNDNTITYNNVAFIVTENTLYITTSVNQWISEKLDVNCDDIIVEQTEIMSNLVEIEKLDEKTIRINFIDDTNDRAELWTCTFETYENVLSTLNAISQSWEQLFGVPLGIN